jgi:hypothetical protein
MASQSHANDSGQIDDFMRDIARRADKFVSRHKGFNRVYYHSMFWPSDKSDEQIHVDDNGVGHLHLAYGHSWDNEWEDMMRLINEVTRVYPLAYVGMEDADWARCEGERGSVWNLHFVTTNGVSGRTAPQ